MDNLIYFKIPMLRLWDPSLASPDYQHHKWFSLHTESVEKWLSHVNSRVHRLDTPWHLADPVSPVPALTHNDLDFGRVMESIVSELEQKINSTGRTAYVAWSGGIDSTAIMVAILKTFSPDTLKNIIILCDQKSIEENPYFYYNFVHNKLQTQETDSFEVTDKNYDKIIICDGEGGNMIFASTRIATMCGYRDNLDLMDQPWRSHKDIKTLTWDNPDFAVELIMDSIKHAPIDIESGFDFLWWSAFNFKFDDVLVRKAVRFTEEFTREQTVDFWENSLCRPYAHPDMQVWSMISKDIRRETLKIVSKYPAKKYIYEFDHNDFYLYSKREEISTSRLFCLANPFTLGTPSRSLIAVDQDWNKYYLSDPSTREKLGQILQRNTK
jgi:hypothetical protein